MVIALLEMLLFLVLIIVHHLILMIEKKNLVLGEGPTQGINGTVEKKIVLTLVKQIQNFAKF